MKNLAIVVVIMAILGVVGFLVMRASKNMSSAANTSNVSNAMTEPVITIEPTRLMEKTETGMFSGSFKELAMRGGSYVCTFNIDDKGTGTVYVANGKMAGTMSMTTDGVTVPMSMIGDSKQINMWMDIKGMGKMGFVMDMEKMVEKGKEMNGKVSASQIDQIQKKYNYDCKPWSSDASKFVLPSDINFKPL